MNLRSREQPLVVGIVRTPDPLNNCKDLYRDAVSLLQLMRGVCVVETEQTLDSLASAAAVSRQFNDQSVDLTILMCCRLSGDGKIVEPFMHSDQEVMVWSVPEPEQTGNLTLNSLTCANLYISVAKELSETCLNKQAKWLHGGSDSIYFKNRLRTTIDAMRTQKRISSSAVLRVGNTAEGFINLFYSPEAVHMRFGVKMRDITLKTLTDKMEAVSQPEADVLAKRMTDWASDSAGFESEMEQSARLVLALESICGETGVDALALRCWPEIQCDLKFSACLAVSWLNEQGTIVSCEGDAPGALTMLVMQEMTGEKPLLLDMVAADLEKGLIQFWHCGIGMKCYADGTGCKLIKYPCDPAILDHPGACVDMKYAPQPVTICRLSGEDTGKMLICQAEIVSGPDAGFDGGRGWFANFTMDGRPMTAAEFIDTAFQFGSPHHYVICAGHAENALREFAFRLNLEVAQKRNYRDYLR